MLLHIVLIDLLLIIISGESLWNDPEYMLVSKLRRCKLVHYVISHDTVKEFGSETDALNRIEDITHQMQKSYAWHNFELKIGYIETWLIKNKIPILNNYSATIKNLAIYNRDKIVTKRHKYPLILFTSIPDTTKKDAKILGISYLGSECLIISVGIVWINYGLLITNVASTTSHELGHILGLPHQEISTECRCAFNTNCLMSPTLFQWNEKKFAPSFDTCSAQCLLDHVKPCEGSCNHLVAKFDNCGNGVYQHHQGEQCDCGPEEVCTARGVHKCCDNESCNLRSGSKCSVEECCENCQPKSGMKCREKKDPFCDLTEFCVGSDIHCAEDVYVRDGEPCNDNGYCFDGQCTQLDNLCQNMLYDNDAKYSKFCNDMISRDYRHMNCDPDNIDQLKDHKKFICLFNGECDPIVCETNNKLRVSISSAIYEDIWGKKRTCLYHKNLDYNTVKGIPCGDTKGNVCINRKCVPVSEHTTSCPKCSSNEVCNNHGVCVKKI